LVGLFAAAGLAICEALSFACATADFTVKWPNDVYANGRKIAGILIESPAQARGRLIVGIGVNVNNSFAAAPEELQETATSLCDIEQQTQDPTHVLLGLLGRLQQRWEQLRTQGFAAVRDDWEARSLLNGRTVTLQAGAQRFIGRCLGIDDDGSLVLQTEQGRQSIAAGSVVQFE
jgi:BirA family biotin operon repressor/biotin-[acetyl-CoA-carboxylase] ligase